MKTTIEISGEQSARLLALAVRRGKKRVSTLVQEALARYLGEQASHIDRVDAALALGGTLSDESATALEASVQALQGRWR